MIQSVAFVPFFLAVILNRGLKRNVRASEGKTHLKSITE